MNRKFWTVFIVWQVVAELFCWCPSHLFHLPYDSVIGLVFGGVGALGLMPGKLLGMSLLWTLHLKMDQVPALGISVEVLLNLMVWLAFVKLTHGISMGFKGIEWLFVRDSETLHMPVAKRIVCNPFGPGLPRGGNLVLHLPALQP